MRFSMVCEDLLEACSYISFCLCSAPLWQAHTYKPPYFSLALTCPRSRMMASWPAGPWFSEGHPVTRMQGLGKQDPAQRRSWAVPEAPSLPLQEELVFWGHLITPCRKLFQLQCGVLDVTLLQGHPEDWWAVKFCLSSKQWSLQGLYKYSVSFLLWQCEGEIGGIFIMKTWRKVNGSE